ncbi:hypothetical protein KY290_000940 [Solanum tuberosum]|uniref:Longin domain-containing protein n=1 Tax=Solanum tuberosum TaxID=4113 RepID=A0ABQ7WKP9_SOLTU|nr:hypothetical protein KY290_000940 [Solanum tuberosum]
MIILHEPLTENAVLGRIPFSYLEDIQMRFMKNYGKVASYGPAYSMNDEFSRVLHQQMGFFSSIVSMDACINSPRYPQFIKLSMVTGVPRGRQPQGTGGEGWGCLGEGGLEARGEGRCASWRATSRHGRHRGASGRARHGGEGRASRHGRHRGAFGRAASRHGSLWAGGLEARGGGDSSWRADLRHVGAGGLKAQEGRGCLGDAPRHGVGGVHIS